MIRIKTKTKKKKKKATSRNHIHSINATNKSVISSATNRTENTSDEQKQTNTIANYFDYQINQTKKKKKNRRYLLLYGFPIVIILLTILIILPILFLNQSTIITSTSLITNPCKYVEIHFRYSFDLICFLLKLKVIQSHVVQH